MLRILFLVLGVGERSSMSCSTRSVDSEIKMQAFLFLSSPSSSEPTVLLLLQRKNPKLMLRILFLVLGVGVEPTKAEAGRFTV